MTIVGHTHIGVVLRSSLTPLAFLTLFRQMGGHPIWLKTIASLFVTWRNRSRMGLLSVLPNARFIQTASTGRANLSSDRSMLFPKPNGRLRDSKWSIDVFGILVYRSGLQRRISPPRQDACCFDPSRRQFSYARLFKALHLCGKGSLLSFCDIKKAFPRLRESPDRRCLSNFKIICPDTLDVTYWTMFSKSTGDPHANDSWDCFSQVILNILHSKVSKNILLCVDNFILIHPSKGSASATLSLATATHNVFISLLRDVLGLPIHEIRGPVSDVGLGNDPVCWNLAVICCISVMT